MGALPAGRGEVLAYEAWDGGVTGLGFAEILPA
jgi:protocatechuate 4,5-dioxygenase beta chain